MTDLTHYIHRFQDAFPELSGRPPWELIGDISAILIREIQRLPDDFVVKGNIAIHKTAVIEDNVVVKGPMIISANCFIAAHCYLRNGIYLGKKVCLGPGCEIKSSFIFSNSSLAHFNFVGDSLIGSDVNLEAGAVIANHFNERASREIQVLLEGKLIKTGMEKFGALVGDQTKIGANAVLSPGTILPPGSVVKRLQLVEQG